MPWPWASLPKGGHQPRVRTPALPKRRIADSIMYMEQWDIEDKLQKKIDRIRKFRIALSLILAVFGSVLLVSVLLPYIRSTRQVDEFAQAQESLMSPIPDSQKRIINNQLAYYDPSRSYWENLNEEAAGAYTESTKYFDAKTQSYKDIVVNQQYDKLMKLSIPAVGINNIRLQPNVQSDNEKVYDAVLKLGLAHFKGTPIPGDGGNSFIYGHSALDSFFSRHKDNPETIFSKLPDVNIGDKILIVRDGETLQYTVKQKKIIEATDFSVLKPSNNKESVTLMTCWPLGVGTKRLIVVGERNG